MPVDGYFGGQMRYGRVSIVGAFDRHNYGDLLFPLIVQEAVFRRGGAREIGVYSTTDSNLSRYGAIPTQSLHSFYNLKSVDTEIVVVAGGEVLAANWQRILGNLTNRLAHKMLRRVSDFVGDEASAYVISRMLGVKASQPFVIQLDSLNRYVSIAYNAVGGSHLENSSHFVKNNVKRQLTGVSHVSVRDHKSAEMLASMGIKNVFISPDCAAALAKYYPLTSIEAQISPNVKRVCDEWRGTYCCFQSASSYMDGQLPTVKEQLLKLVKEHNVPIVLFNIGRAAGHSDQISSANIAAALKSETHVKLVDTANILDIIYVIANSRVYAGTSLHGAITAMAYAIPHVGMCPDQISKLSSYLKSWSVAGAYGLAEFSNLAAECSQVMRFSRPNLELRAKQLADLVESNFDQIFTAHNNTIAPAS